MDVVQADRSGDHGRRKYRDQANLCHRRQADAQYKLDRRTDKDGIAHDDAWIEGVSALLL